MYVLLYILAFFRTWKSIFWSDFVLKKTYLHNNFYIIYIQCLFNRVFQRKNSVIKIVKMAGGQITTPTVFKKECCSFADICTCVHIFLGFRFLIIYKKKKKKKIPAFKL